jgi:V/A-type H+-transporting ATPase subunit I
MALRPAAARWFEVVVPEVDSGDAMLGLASRGAVQFEWTGEHGAAHGLNELAAPIARYRELSARYRTYWPDPVFERRCCPLPVQVAAEGALRQIERWLLDAEDLLARADSLRARQQQLAHWRELLPLVTAQAPKLDLRALAAAGPVLSSVCLRLPKTAQADAGKLESLLSERLAALVLAVRADAHQVWLGVVSSDAVASLCAAAQSYGGECLALPQWCADPAVPEIALSTQLEAVRPELDEVTQELLNLARQHGLHHAAGVLERVEWFYRTGQEIRCDGRLCWITGWTSESDAKHLEDALLAAGVRGRAALPAPPADVAEPSLLRHGSWLRPFEVFTQAIGEPSTTEADPTVWVALLVPLLFGYMCGDVGHGAVIALAGFLLRDRTEHWPLLMICGVSALGFGFVYGDVFGYEHLIEPLWVRPLEAPLAILAVPLAFGAVVLTLGLLLHTVESCWRGLGRSEGVADTAQLLVYWGLLLSLFQPAALWMCIVGLVLCVGNQLLVHRDPKVVVAGIGHLVEATFSLLLNTLSFARVGAFALAHAALELAVLTIAESVPGLVGTAVVVVLGNLIVVVLEGLVVTIQTSRLVLFEFFVRFFEGSGRAFGPAPQPPSDRPGVSSRKR